MTKFNQFNKDRPCFRNFDEAIKYDTTRRSYHYSLNNFMRFVGLDDYEDLVKMTTEIQQLLKNWVIFQKKQNLIGNTISTKLNAVELFLDMNEISYHKKTVRKMLPDSDRIVGGDVPFTTEDIAQLKQVAKKPRDVAMIDFLASTGVRPGCLSDPVLRLKHVEDMPHGCKAVRIYDGSRDGYWAFLTPEASQSLEKYLKWREFNHEELNQDSVLFKTYENPNTQKEFLTADSVRQMLVNLMTLAGIERKKIKNRYDKAVAYGFRKRFNGILKMNNDVNSNIAEKLMAHKLGLDGNYLKPTREECFAEFVKAIFDLTISDEARDKVKITKLEKEKSEFHELKEELSEVKLELSAWRDAREALYSAIDGGPPDLLEMTDPHMCSYLRNHNLITDTESYYKPS